MQTTPEKLRETLADVIAKHNDASASHALLHSQWHEAAAKGEDAKADKLEIEIEKARRLMMRLDLRRTSLEQDIGSAEELERAQLAAKLKATADSILGRAVKRITDLEPLCGTLAELVRALETDLHDYKEARYFAQQAGATPEGFATQENDARVSRIVESLGVSKNRVSGVAKEMSRVSVFM
jgi:hypothetical protein